MLYNSMTKKFDKQSPGTGPFGAMRMRDHHTCAQIFAGNTGYSFPPKGPIDAGV